MTQKHTPGPWEVQIDAGYVTITQVDWDTIIAEVSRKQDAERIVADHNALLDLDPEAVPELVAALENLFDYAGSYVGGLRTTGPYRAVTAALAKVKRAPGRGEETDDVTE